VIRAWLTRDPIQAEEVLDRVRDASDGAVVLFLGVVRDHNEGRDVRGIEYEAYQEMAMSVMTAIALEAGESVDTDRIAVVHRTGELEVGEVSLAIAVGSPHREEAYQASRYIIEEIKKRVPMWKKERFADGETSWVEGVRLEDGEE
jgi:molybdopterin synthase catalytic subunit